VEIQHHNMVLMIKVILRRHHPIAITICTIWIEEAFAARIINIEMFTTLGLWIIVQAEKLNLSSKAQLLGAHVVVHYHGLQSQDPGI